MIYSGGNLAALSAVVCCATRTQTWSPLGAKGGSTQEEVQMMQVGDQLFIACNYGGHTAVRDFLTAYGVSNVGRFIAAIKWSHALISADGTQCKEWICGNLKDKSTYSATEQKTLDTFAFAVDIAKPAELYDHINACVGVEDTEPPDRDNWKTGPFQQTLACYTKTKSYRGTYAAHPVANIGLRRVDQGADTNLKVTLINSTAEVHAELKLLAFLTKMVISGQATGAVSLGGLKAACEKCAAWIASYQKWLAFKNITLNLPADDTRPSAGPVNWGKPTVEESVKANSDLARLSPDLFA